MSNGNKRIGRAAYSAGSVLLVLVIAVLANVVLSRTTLRWDATADDLYSLSDGTRTILAGLEQDVVIKVFYSKHLVNAPSQIKTFAQRVIDFLSEYEHFGKGRIAVQIYDPEPDSEEEEWAVKYGMRGIGLPTGEQLYLGLVALAADQEAAIEFIDPSREARLEYDLTRVIARVQSAKRMKIAVFSGLPIFGSSPMTMGMAGPRPGAEPWFFIQELKKTYDLIEIPPDADRIDPAADLLLLFHPKNLSDGMAFAVDQYLLGGGNLMVFADPLSLMDDPRMGTGGSIPERLFKAWGVGLQPGKAVADYTYATRLRNRSNQVETNPLWLSAPVNAFNADNLVTANLESMLLPIAGAVETLPEAPFTVEPLVQTSTNNMLVDAFMHNMDVDALRRDFKPSGTVRSLAVRITGRFKTAFPDGKPAADAGTDTQPAADTSGGPAALTEANRDAVVIVVADSDLLYDGYYLSQQNMLGFTISNIFNDNLNFLLNACEMLTGNPALIGIRSRGTFERPFTRVQELERKAQDRWLDQEQALVRQVEATNEKLRLLEQQKDASQQAILSEEQEQEIARFQAEKLKISKELKTVRRNLRADIEQLGTAVKFVNIFMVPLLIGIGGIIYAITRRREA